jgi:hypothetical protein
VLQHDDQASISLPAQALHPILGARRERAVPASGARLVAAGDDKCRPPVVPGEPTSRLDKVHRAASLLAKGLAVHEEGKRRKARAPGPKPRAFDRVAPLFPPKQPSRRDSLKRQRKILSSQCCGNTPMLQSRNRILLAAFAALLAGAGSGWALLAVLPAKATPRPPVGASALVQEEFPAARPAATAPTFAPPSPVVVAPAPAAPERSAKPPSTAAVGRAEGSPANGGTFGFKFEDGSSASLDPEHGRVRLHTPFGNFELKL